MVYYPRQYGRRAQVRYFYIFLREESEERHRKAVSSMAKRIWPRAGLVIAACLAAAALASCAGQSPSASSAQSSASGSDVPAADVTAPQLLGVRDLTVALNGTVSYRDGVSAVDDVDGPVTVEIDAASVDLTAAGEYQVIYSAQDAAGNRAEQTVTVTVVETATVDQGKDEQTEDETPGGSAGGGVPLSEVTQEDVDRLCDQILGRITNSGMSQREKARAIFNYVNGHVKYVGSSDKSSWIIGAYVGFTRGRGDCYNYFACSKALLTRAGISSVDLQRVGGNSRHYWQLVNTGDGWYHFDACPHPNGYPLYAFMITETQARAYTEQVKDARLNYYVYDYGACPVTVEGTPEEVPPEETQPGEGEAPGEGENPGEGEDPAIPPDPTQPPPDQSGGGQDPTQPPDQSGGSGDPTQPPDQSGGGEDPAAPPPDQSGAETDPGGSGNPTEQQPPDRSEEEGGQLAA